MRKGRGLAQLCAATIILLTSALECSSQSPKPARSQILAAHQGLNWNAAGQDLAAKAGWVVLPGSQAALDNRMGRVFLLDSSDNKVLMLDSRSGVVVGSVAIGGYPVLIASGEDEGRVYVVDVKNYQCERSCQRPYPDTFVTTLDSRTGKVLNAQKVAGDPSSLAVDGSAGRLIAFGGSTGYVTELDAGTGQALRSTDLHMDTESAALDVSTSSLFVVHTNGNAVSMLDIRSGGLLRTIRVGLGPSAVAIDERAGRAFVLNSGGASISMVDDRTGAVLRTIPVGELVRPVNLSFLLDDHTSRLFVVLSSYQVAVLDTRSGAVLGLEVAGQLTFAGAVSTGSQRVLLASSADRNIRVLDSATGEVLNIVPVDGVADEILSQVATDDASGHTFAVEQGNSRYDNLKAAGHGAIVCLDTKSGASFKRIDVGATPAIVAVDSLANRFFVANIVSDYASVTTVDSQTCMPLRTVRVSSKPIVAPHD